MLWGRWVGGWVNLTCHKYTSTCHSIYLNTTQLILNENIISLAFSMHDIAVSTETMTLKS